MVVGGIAGRGGGEVWSCGGRGCGGGGGVDVPRPPGYEANPGGNDKVGKVRDIAKYQCRQFKLVELVISLVPSIMLVTCLLITGQTD